jgi:hypothetical protein
MNNSKLKVYFDFIIKVLEKININKLRINNQIKEDIHNLIRKNLLSLIEVLIKNKIDSNEQIRKIIFILTSYNILEDSRIYTTINDINQIISLENDSSKLNDYHNSLIFSLYYYSNIQNKENIIINLNRFIINKSNLLSLFISINKVLDNLLFKERGIITNTNNEEYKMICLNYINFLLDKMIRKNQTNAEELITNNIYYILQNINILRNEESNSKITNKTTQYSPLILIDDFETNLYSYLFNESILERIIIKSFDSSFYDLNTNLNLYEKYFMFLSIEERQRKEVEDLFYHSGEHRT